MTQEEHVVDDVWTSLPGDEEEKATRTTPLTTADHVIPATRQEESRLNVIVHEHHT